LSVWAPEDVTVDFCGAIAGRAVWCGCAVDAEECFPNWQPYVDELEKVCAAGNAEFLPLMME
jgi:hypothetical protein